MFMTNESDLMRLVQSIDKWIWFRAHRLASQWIGADERDLAQEGRLAAWKIAKVYKPGGAASFLTFAGRAINFKMMDAAARCATVVTCPPKVLRKGGLRVCSLEEPKDSNPESTLKVSDTLAAPPSACLEARDDLRQFSTAIQAAYGSLHGMHRWVIELRYSRKLSIKEIEREMKLGRLAIRQLEAEALKAIREHPQVKRLDF